MCPDFIAHLKFCHGSTQLVNLAPGSGCSKNIDLRFMPRRNLNAAQVQWPP